MNIKFSINKGDGERKIFFRYRPNRRIDIRKATPFSINKELWDDVTGNIKPTARKRNPRTKQEQSYNHKIDTLSVELSSFKTDLESFIFSKKGLVTTESVEEFLVKNGYAPPEIVAPKSVIPDTISGFFDYHIEEIISEISTYKSVSHRTILKYKTIKNHLTTKFPKLKISDVNNAFMVNYRAFRKNMDTDTINKELSIIKQFVKDAHFKKMQISDDVLSWRFFKKKREYQFPTLSFTELTKIKELNLKEEHLSTARDWLIIGCNTGLRVSDLLDLKKENLEEGNTVYYIQKKTNNESGAILYGDAAKIIEKNDGEFPRPMSDQKFNLHIKKLCELAKINEKILGGKKINKKLMVDFYPKHELVSSHICRRSFVSNYISKLGREEVQYNTGHLDGEMLKLYDQRNLRKKSQDIRDNNRKNGLDI